MFRLMLLLFVICYTGDAIAHKLAKGSFDPEAAETPETRCGKLAYSRTYFGYNAERILVSEDSLEKMPHWLFKICRTTPEAGPRVSDTIIRNPRY